ncbi:hypothetical protein VDG1235_3417 [Verrucomicrobiia bacterium DG1235]|nr:hypothetical protein VDG1235_3417 [Verrucomicrobiae bacterium DG1235]
MKLQLDHIAILSNSLSKTEATLPAELKRHEIETFSSEGTKEQYLELIPNKPPYLLLLESIGNGPYQRTLEKRGAGLHHFGFCTDDLEASVTYFHRHGLLLHPISLETLKRDTIWLCRPGIPFLLELNKTDQSIENTDFVIKASIPTLTERILWVPGLELIESEKPEICLEIGSSLYTINT